MKNNNLSRTLASLLIVVCVIGAYAKPKKERWSLQQPYHHPISGIGGGAIVGSILIPNDAERTIASRALVESLQALQLAVIKPQVGLNGTISPGVRWTTDIAPVPADVVAAHNARFSTLRLKPAYYGVAYEGMHDTANSTFRYRIAAHLYAHGALSDWSAVADSKYSGEFFIQRLATEIQHQLQKAATKK